MPPPKKQFSGTYFRKPQREETHFKFEFHYIIDAKDKHKITECTLVIGDLIWTGYAQCHPKDQFTRDKGRKIALAYAIKKHMIHHFNFPKPARREIWKVYFEARGKEFPGNGKSVQSV